MSVPDAILDCEASRCVRRLDPLVRSIVVGEPAHRLRWPETLQQAARAAFYVRPRLRVRGVSGGAVGRSHAATDPWVPRSATRADA